MNLFVKLMQNRSSVIITLLLVLVSSISAAEWPQYRKGLTRSGISEDGQNLMYLKWQSNISIGMQVSNLTSPIIIPVGDEYYTIYTAANGTVWALNNSANRDLVWTYTNSSAFINALTSGSLSSGTVVFGLSEKGSVVALDGDDGGLRWQKKFGGALDTSPLFISDSTGKYRMFFNTQGDVIKVDAENGNQIWLKKKCGVNMQRSQVLLCARKMQNPFFLIYRDSIKFLLTEKN